MPLVRSPMTLICQQAADLGRSKTSIPLMAQVGLILALPSMAAMLVLADTLVMTGLIRLRGQRTLLSQLPRALAHIMFGRSG